MAEYKQYITQIQENGSVMISEDVVATIVAHALSEVEGVGSLGVKPGVSIADFTNKKNWGKGLKILIAEDNTLTIECGIMVCYGYSVVDVAKDVQAAVTASVESITGTKVESVSVNVCGIVQVGRYEKRRRQRTGSTSDLRSGVHRRRAGTGGFHPPEQGILRKAG